MARNKFLFFLVQVSKIIIFFLAIWVVVVWLQDGSSGVNKTLSAKQNELFRLKLNRKVGELSDIAPLCHGYPSKAQCDQGDGLLFNGLLCLSGLPLGCRFVAESQSEEGQVFRNPELRKQSNEREVNSFSRDMAFGALAYLVATKDVAFAKRWRHWIDTTGEGQLCLDASDGRCEFTPGFWNLFGQVWEFLGLPQSSKMLSDIRDSTYLPLQAKVTPHGFALHLLGVNLLLKKRMGFWSEIDFLTSQILLERQPENLFFKYLAGKSVEELLSGVGEQCHVLASSKMNQWHFERASDDEAWLDSAGWECIMLINFILIGMH